MTGWMVLSTVWFLKVEWFHRIFICEIGDSEMSRLNLRGWRIYVSISKVLYVHAFILK